MKDKNLIIYAVIAVVVLMFVGDKFAGVVSWTSDCSYGTNVENGNYVDGTWIMLDNVAYGWSSLIYQTSPISSTRNVGTTLDGKEIFESPTYPYIYVYRDFSNNRYYYFKYSSTDADANLAEACIISTCSYPSTYDCDNYDEYMSVKNEYTASPGNPCAMADLQACIDNYLINACGDGICDTVEIGEDSSTCPADCGTPSTCSYPSIEDCKDFYSFDIVSNEWLNGICDNDEIPLCANVYLANACGDGVCDTEKAKESNSNCPSDCSITCSSLESNVFSAASNWYNSPTDNSKRLAVNNAILTWSNSC